MAVETSPELANALDARSTLLNGGESGSEVPSLEDVMAANQAVDEAGKAPDALVDL